MAAAADPGGCGMASAAGIHLDGMGKPTEIQISQCWVLNHARGIYMTVPQPYSFTLTYTNHSRYPAVMQTHRKPVPSPPHCCSQ